MSERPITPRTKYPEYMVWQGMKKRCSNPNNRCFADYGGRGITVCERWQKDFYNFLEDMGPRPSKSHSLDRINNDGPYEPNNCRWADAFTQGANKRSTIYVNINGVTLPACVVRKIHGVSRVAFQRRIKRGWTPEEAATVKTMTRWSRRTPNARAVA